MEEGPVRCGDVLDMGAVVDLVADATWSCTSRS